MRRKIAILGWGSLIWDTDTGKGRDLELQCSGEWKEAVGLELPLEFSRVSESRKKALTLVIDETNGALCCVQYRMSKRKELDDAICDLRSREGTNLKNIGYWSADGRTEKCGVVKRIGDWAEQTKIDAVVWTALESNFFAKSKNKREEFTVESAIRHIKNLPREGKVLAAEYVWKAPEGIRTKLRDELETAPWF